MNHTPPRVETPPLERALRVLRLLSEQRGWATAKDLVRRLDEPCSVRTMHRTLDALKQARVPLERRRSAHGEHEIRLPQIFHAPPDLLSPDEALAALLLSPFADHFAGSRMGRVVEGLVGKLEQLLPGGSLLDANGLVPPEHVVQVRTPGQAPAAGEGLLLSALVAILERRNCRVDYHRLGAQESRDFEAHPHGLIFHAGAIYLLVWQPRHENWLPLPLHRLRGLAPSGEHFQRQQDFRLQDFINGAFGIWSQAPEEVDLLFQPRLADFVLERQWHPSQRGEILPEGHLRLRLRVGLSPELRAWILRWGEWVEVLQPASLRQEIASSLRAAAARYSEPTVSKGSC